VQRPRRARLPATAEKIGAVGFQISRRRATRVAPFSTPAFSKIAEICCFGHCLTRSFELETHVVSIPHSFPTATHPTTRSAGIDSLRGLVGFIEVDEPLTFVPRHRRWAAAVYFGQSPRDPVFDGLRRWPAGGAAAPPDSSGTGDQLAKRTIPKQFGKSKGDICRCMLLSFPRFALVLVCWASLAAGPALARPEPSDPLPSPGKAVPARPMAATYAVSRRRPRRPPPSRRLPAEPVLGGVDVGEVRPGGASSAATS
jgi:hypothetical protein